MIAVNKSRVEIEGTEAVVVAETMCLINTFIKEVLIPKWGSKENARNELNKMLDKVFEDMEVSK